MLEATTHWLIFYLKLVMRQLFSFDFIELVTVSCRPTRKSVITKLNQDQDSEDEDELPLLDSLLASEEPEVPLPKDIITAKALEAMKKAEIKRKHEELEETNDLKGPEESKECDKTYVFCLLVLEVG